MDERVDAPGTDTGTAPVTVRFAIGKALGSAAALASLSGVAPMPIGAAVAPVSGNGADANGTTPCVDGCIAKESAVVPVIDSGGAGGGVSTASDAKARCQLARAGAYTKTTKFYIA